MRDGRRGKECGMSELSAFKMQQKLHRNYSCQQDTHTHTHSGLVIGLTGFCFAFAQMGQTPKTIKRRTVCPSVCATVASNDACYGRAMSWALIKWALLAMWAYALHGIVVFHYSPDKLFPRRQRQRRQQ